MSDIPNLQSIGHFLDDRYDIKATIKELVAYQDRNFLVTTLSGTKYILKITTGVDELEFIRSQNWMLVTLSHLPVGKFLPCPVSTIEGEQISEINFGGGRAYARLFHFIEGTFLAEAMPEVQFYHELGRTFAQIDRDMAGLEDAVLKSRTHEWDLARVMETADDVKLIQDPADRRLVYYFLMKFREEVLPVYYKLPKGLIHGDGNDWNILLSDYGLAGVIDFGDLVWGARVNELAILLAYAMMGRNDFRDVYNMVIAGYQDVIELSDIELSVLYYLIASRWCQTMVMAARQEIDKPGSEYHQISVTGARKMLHLWVKQNPVTGLRNAVDEYSSGDGFRSPIDGHYRYFSKALSLSYHEPLHMIGAAMQYMYGADGRTYLDCVNNIPHVGHCHPKVVEAGQRQMARLNTNTRYLYNSLELYAEKLLSKFPSSLNKIFFVNSGSAATDLAVRLAESHTGCEYLVLDNAYHGNTKAAIGLSPYKFDRRGGRGKPGNVTILNSQLQTQAHSLTHSSGRKEKTRPLTFFAESIVGCAGQIMLSTAWMQEIVRTVRESGGIYVADEVQTGFGRVGHKFWGFELYDIVPDIVILGKPMGNGHPMGAVVCTGEIAHSFETGMEFFSSFGGNTVSCEIGLAVLEVIEEEGLQENARNVGDFLLRELNSQYTTGSGQRSAGWEQSEPPIRCQVSEVRGSGLFLGIELTDPKTGKPATEAAVSIVNSMKDRGFLLSTDGPFNNVIKIKPPMCFSMENALELTGALKSMIG